MSGAVVAAASGVGFGLFQTLNIRAVRGMDPFVSTFVQIAVAAAALLAASLATGGLSELGDAPTAALLYFAAAGLLHFIAGWTLLNISQKRIGAARTSPLLTTVPLFGIAIAALTVGQLPEAIELPAIALMVLGGYVVVSRGAGGGGRHVRPVDAAPALACALCWALSPALTVHGLDRLDDPLVGLTLGLCVSVVGYLLAFAAWRRGIGVRTAGRQALAIKLLAGVLVGLSTWGRWAALDGTTVAAVLALNLLSIPVVLIASPLMAGRHAEHVTPRVWAGAALVVAGSLLLIVAA